MKKILVIVGLLGLAVLFPTTAQAYLDPGSGSAMLQILITVAISLGVGLKLFWRRIIGWFGHKPKTPGDGTTTPKP